MQFQKFVYEIFVKALRSESPRIGRTLLQSLSSELDRKMQQSLVVGLDYYYYKKDFH